MYSASRTHEGVEVTGASPFQSQRPELTRDLDSGELLRWYWLKDELMSFARSLGVRPHGSKELLTQRLAAALDGRTFVESTPKRPAGAVQLSAPVDGSTVIPEGQRCSQVVRHWFIQHVGESFSFDGSMRAFFARADGTSTLQDALDHYRATRRVPAAAIDPQFEYNRFTRAWYAHHPQGSREELLAAWRLYRARPVEERGRI